MMWRRRPRPARLPLALRMAGDCALAPLFFGATAFFGTLSLAASLFEKDGRMQHRIARAWASTSMRIALSPVTVVGKANLLRHPVAVYAANHVSYMDTPALFSAIPFQFRILARQGLWKVPFIGWHLDRSGQIPVDTEEPKASTLKSGVKALKAGMPLVVFPEGGRTNDGQLSNFMSGPAFMAILAGVPLVPMAIVGTYELLPMHTRHFFPQPVTLMVGEPISTAGFTTKRVDELTDLLKTEVARLHATGSHFAVEPVEEKDNLIKAEL